MKKTIHGIFLLLVLLAVTLSACTSTAGPTGTEESAYPALNPQGQVIPNYPSAQTFTTAKMEDLNPLTDAPQPDEGMASISGIIYVPREQLVMTKTQFYLTAGEGENKDQLPLIQVVGGIASRGDILGETDENGVFTLNNIPPGNYFLVASPANGVIVAIVSELDTNPRLITLEANQKLPLGVVVLPNN